MSMCDVSLDLYHQIVEKHFQDMSIESFDIRFIESNDMENAYYIARPDQAGKDSRNNHEYHGFCVPPTTINGPFYILLKKDYMEEAKKNLKFEWIGTIIHEVTHADDYRKYQKTVSAQSYDELFDLSIYRVFSFWTEYHARVIGTKHMMKYRKDNHSPYAEHDNLVAEFEVVANWYNDWQNKKCVSGERLLECDATLLGILRVLEICFPATFNDEVLTEVESLKKLYCFLKDHDTIEKAAPCFEELHDLLKGVHPCMP